MQIPRRTVLLTPALAACQIRSSVARPNPRNELESIRLFCVGDVMTGRGIDQILPHPGSSAIEEPFVKDAGDYVTLAERSRGTIPRRATFDYPWGDALKHIAARSPDLRLINLETSVTVSRERAPKDINYKMHPANAGCLTSAQIECATLANNHVLDWGNAGLLETLQVLRDRGIRTVGAGENAEQARRPAIFELKGKGRVLVFGFALESSGVPEAWRANGGPGVFLLRDVSKQSVRELAGSVAEFKRRDDVVVGSMHWGPNFGYAVSEEQRSFARALIDEAGIDLVHGHSSHHAKGIECYRRKLILYGCGDFVNDYEGIPGNEEYRPNLRLMYFPTLRKGSGELAELQIVVMESRRFRLRQAASEDAAWVRAMLRRESALSSLRVRVDANDTIYVVPT